jgi:Autotransporter beta-domain
MSIAYRSRLTAALMITAALPLVSAALADDASPLQIPPVGTASPLGWSTGAYVYTGSRDTLTTDQSSSAHIDMTGGIGVLEYSFPWLSLAVIGNVGHSHIGYLQVLQDTYASSQAVGLRASADLGPLVVTVGSSVAHDGYQSVLQNGIGTWDGSEREIHGSVASHIDVAGPLWLAPLAGFRYLDLSQDGYLLGSSIIPSELDISRLAFAGTKVELRLRDELSNVLTPWFFAGFTHEFANQAPLGPSVFFTEQMAGNEYTLFPQGTSGVPAVFPGHDTGVFGAGFDLELMKVVTINGAVYRENNADFNSVNYKFGGVVRW